MLEKIILLTVILLLGILSKNQTIIIAVLFLICVVLLRFNDSVLINIKQLSIKYGIVLLSISAFIPIAKGDITHHEIITSLTTWRAWVAIIAGVFVTQFAKYGIEIMNTSPDVTTFVLVGIIIGILVFKGAPTGPLIGSGIALMLFSMVNFFIFIFK